MSVERNVPAERDTGDPVSVGPEVVLDVEVRAGAFVLVLANTGTSTAFEPRVAFDAELVGLHGTMVVSQLPVWTGLAMLRPGCSVDVVLDAQSAQRAPEQRTFSVEVSYLDGAGRAFGRRVRHDLDAYVGLPALLDS
jgi:hypothetical protein